MMDGSMDRNEIIDTHINFWPSLVDGITTVLIVMFLLYIVKTAGGASDELEATKARQALMSLQTEITQLFEREGRRDIVKCKYSTNMLRVTFSDGVLFASRGSYLQPEGKSVLATCARALTSVHSKFEQIQVEGHTDSVVMKEARYPRDNWELSSARALEVLKELVRLGVHPKVISANGYADQVKNDLGTGEEANRKNRRIELRIIYSMPKATAGDTQ